MYLLHRHNTQSCSYLLISHDFGTLVAYLASSSAAYSALVLGLGQSICSDEMLHHNITIILLQFFVACSYATTEEFIVAGYLPDYRSYINMNVTSLHLTDVMLFSLTPEAVTRYSESSSAAGCCLSEKHYALLREARSYKLLEQSKSRLRLLITIGGGGRSDGFGSIVTGSSSTKRHFLEELTKLW